MKLRQLARFGQSIPAVLSTETVAADDEVGAAIGTENLRYERQVLDFESEVRRRRDAMRAEHLANMKAILSAEEEEAAE